MLPQTPRVLLAEDGISETGITLRALCADQGRRLELVFVSNADRLSQALLHSQPHIAFLALSLLQPDPSRTISLLHHSAPHIPLILFLEPADKASAFGCLHAGAENNMLEGFIDVPTLDHVLHTAIQRDAPSAAPAQCQPHLHSVTKLPNRSGLLQRLLHASQFSVLSGSRLLISVHLTNLKYLQSSAGHAAVARSLRHIAHQLQTLVRRSDLLAYVAPGIFALVIFDANESSLASLRRRIECRLLQFIQRDPSRLPLNFSVKSSSWTQSSSFSFQEVLARQISCKKPHALSSPAAPVNFARHRLLRSGQ